MRQVRILGKVENDLVRAAYELKALITATVEQQYQARLRVAADAVGVPHSANYTVGVFEGGYAFEFDIAEPPVAATGTVEGPTLVQ